MRAGGLEELQRRLLSVVKAHLPEYGVVACSGGGEAPADGVGRCIPISGVPEALENPLEPLSRYFLENSLAGDYAVVLEKAPRNLFHRRAARSEQKRAAKKSGGQLTKQAPISGDQRSAAVRDYAEEMRLEESVKAVERHQSSLVLRGWVWVTSFAESRVDAELFVKGASTVIVGALSGHRSSSTLRVGPVRGRPPGPGPAGPRRSCCPARPCHMSGYPSTRWAPRSYRPLSSSCLPGFRERSSWGRSSCSRGPPDTMRASPWTA